MTRTARPAGVLAGALLALGLLVTAPAASAKAPSDEPFQFTCTEDSASTTAAADTTAGEPGHHPSGKDGKGETEPGGSGTQGRSDRDPDGMANGGSDKPGCEGGYDDDRDGNNGCGNDADFEDDNNGNCGKKGQAEDGAVTAFRFSDEPAADDPSPAEEPAPADDPTPVVKAAPAVAAPAPVVAEDPAPATDEEVVEGPIVWGDEDDSNDPDPDQEYGDPIPASTEAPTADPTGSPDMQLAAHRDLARTGGLLALGLLAAGSVLFGSGRLAIAVARRRLTD
ncbi:MAG TPA: hypothetical protein VGL92_12045 [Acidimicrobiia bacterium]